MFFDAHGDILTDVALQLVGGRDIWQDYHYDLYEKGQVTASIFVNYTDPSSEFRQQEFNMINNLALNYFKELEDINIVYQAKDFDFSKFNVIFGIEGLSCVKPNELKKMYDLGYRHFSLTWNEKNIYASGCEHQGGLTELGYQIVKEAQELGMVIDYAHLNIQSFMELAKVSTKPILVSHGNVIELCEHVRNYNNEQLNLIKESNGVIGLSVIAGFLNSDKHQASIGDLVNHIFYLIDLIGIDHIGFGFDFCYYLESHKIDNQVKGLETIEKVTDLKELLLKRGISESDFNKIAYGNMYRVICDCLV